MGELVENSLINGRTARIIIDYHGRVNDEEDEQLMKVS
jgi:hypothetical protein